MRGEISDATLLPQRRVQIVHDTRTDEIVANGWTRAQCRAIEWSLGGGFLLMAVVEAVVGC